MENSQDFIFANIMKWDSHLKEQHIWARAQTPDFLRYTYNLIWNKHPFPVCAMNMTFISTDLGVQKPSCLNFPVTKPNVYLKAPSFWKIENLVSSN